MHEARIITNPRVMVGKPVIKGTRITVEHILRKLAAGWSHQELLMAHPQLTEGDIRAALAFGADQVAKSLQHS